METEVLDIKQDPKKALEHALSLLEQEEVIVIPSETVYGLGANVYSEKAVSQIYQIKNRPTDNPLICHVYDKPSLKEIASLNSSIDIENLMSEFWPGPLTLILNKSKNLKTNYASIHFSTVAVRMPQHPFFRALLQKTHFPIAAPSANISGRPSGTHWEDVYKELKGKVRLILKDDPSLLGIESTVLDVSQETPTLLRPGMVTLEELKTFYSNISTDTSQNKKEVLSPGLKYQHYKPFCQVVLYHSLKDAFFYLKAHPEYKFPVFLLLEQEKEDIEDLKGAFEMLLFKDEKNFAQNLYHKFYEMEEAKKDILFVKALAKENLGASLMERLERSSDKIL